MSTITRPETKAGSVKTAFGSTIKTRVLISAAVVSAGAGSFVTTYMVPAAAHVFVALGGLAAHNPILLGVAALFVIGQSVPLSRRSKKAGNGGSSWVACTKCNRVFRDQAEVEGHSAGYHV